MLTQQAGEPTLGQLHIALQYRQGGLEFMGNQTDEGFALLLKFFALTNVTGNGRCPNNDAVAIPDRRDGDRNMQLAPVFAHTNRLVVVQTLASTQLLHDMDKFVLAVWWEEKCDRLTY